MIRCPVCETENSGAVCTQCGRPLEELGAIPDEVAPLEGLEMTPVSSADLTVRVEPLPGVEHTRLEPQMDVAQNWVAGPIPLERTGHPEAGDAPAGSAAVDLDLGRAVDRDERTPAPSETAVCPFCGTPSLDAICNNCGRRKFRTEAPVEERVAATGDDTTVCPSCFARVRKDVRCSDCGMPFPFQEL